jgi:hypothetical protein
VSQAARKAGGESGTPKFIRRIVVDVIHPGGEPGTVVMYSDKLAPIRAEHHGDIRFDLVLRQFFRGLGCEVRAVDARNLGGPEDKLDSWESVYRALEGDAGRLLAANDPRIDIEL